MSFIGSRLEKSVPYSPNDPILPLKATTFKGPGCVLSNFFPCSLVLFGRTFNSSEQAYQYKKALNFEDFPTASQILQAEKASRCRSLTRHLQHDSWDAIKVGVLEHVVRAKLEQVPQYRQALLDAEDLIVEAVPGEFFWSAGLSSHDVIRCVPSQWPGRNVMGMIHMLIRNELRSSMNQPSSSVSVPPLMSLSVQKAPKRSSSLLEATDPQMINKPADRTLEVQPAKKARTRQKQGCPLSDIVPCCQPTVDRIERHLGRHHLPSVLVTEKDKSGLERCFEVNNFLQKLCKAVGVTSSEQLLPKAQELIKSSTLTKSYSIQPLQVSLVREFHQFLGHPLPIGEIDLVSPNCVAALMYWVNVVLIIRSLPKDTIFPLLDIPWCPGPSTSDRTSGPPKPIEPAVIPKQGPSTSFKTAVSSTVGSTGETTGPSVRPKSYSAAVSTPAATVGSRTESKPTATIVCRDVRLYNPDGTLRVNPCFDNPTPIVEYGTDCHFHLDLLSKRKGSHKLNKLIEDLDPKQKFALLVTCFCFPNTNPDVFRQQIIGDSRMRVCFGLHPKAASHAITYPSFWQHLRVFLRTYPKVVAIGEVGLDFSVSNPSEKDQTSVLSDIVRLASETKLPLVIHCRDAKHSEPSADKKCIDVLKCILPAQHRIYKHCVTGYREAKLWLDHFPNTYFGINGILLMSPSEPGKKHNYIEEAAIRLPLDRLFLESDAPFLHPSGKKVCNSPAIIFRVAERIACLRGKDITTSDVLAQTRKNARSFFS